MTTTLICKCEGMEKNRSFRKACKKGVLLKNIQLSKTLSKIQDSKFLMGQKAWEFFDVVYGLAPLVVVQVAKC